MELVIIIERVNFLVPCRQSQSQFILHKSQFLKRYMNGVRGNDTICWIHSENAINISLNELDFSQKYASYSSTGKQATTLLGAYEKLPWQLSSI